MSTSSKAMVDPSALLHSFMQETAPVVIGLAFDPRVTLSGRLLGYDEFMNIVLGDTVETDRKTGKATNIGKILLRHDCVGYIHKVGV